MSNLKYQYFLDLLNLSKTYNFFTKFSNALKRYIKVILHATREGKENNRQTGNYSGASYQKG